MQDEFDFERCARALPAGPDRPAPAATDAQWVDAAVALFIARCIRNAATNLERLALELRSRERGH